MTFFAHKLCNLFCIYNFTGMNRPFLKMPLYGLTLIGLCSNDITAFRVHLASSHVVCAFGEACSGMRKTLDVWGQWKH